MTLSRTPAAAWPSPGAVLGASERVLDVVHAVVGARDAPVGATPKTVVWRKNKAQLFRYTRDTPAFGRGRLQMGGRAVRLERIACPLLNVAASADAIAPRPTTRAILSLVSSQDRTELVIKGGHVGIVVGRVASRELWPRVAEPRPFKYSSIR